MMSACNLSEEEILLTGNNTEDPVKTLFQAYWIQTNLTVMYSTKLQPETKEATATCVTDLHKIGQKTHFCVYVYF